MIITVAMFNYLLLLSIGFAFLYFRWLNAVKTSHGARGDMVTAATKAETLKDDLESETQLFQQYQDTLATEMLSFVSKEHELSSWVTKVDLIFCFIVSSLPSIVVILSNYKILFVIVLFFVLDEILVQYFKSIFHLIFFSMFSYLKLKRDITMNH